MWCVLIIAGIGESISMQEITGFSDQEKAIKFSEFVAGNRRPGLWFGIHIYQK